MPKKEDLLDELLGLKKPIPNRIRVPETVRTGSKTITDTSVLRAFHLFLTGKHDRGPKEGLINKLITELEKVK